MNIEFHYYIIYFLANRAGFSDEEAYTIAYSSQFVDDNIIIYEIQTGDTPFITKPTQNYGFWDRSYPNEVFLPFHFVPGGPRNSTGNSGADGLRKGGPNPFSCTADSRNSKDLFIGALKTRNLYRIGIAVHAYADTWAHQHFSGYLEKWNELDPSSVMPAIGHAQALKNPDTIEGIWEDPRMPVGNRVVRNRERFFKAARKIYKYFCVHNRRSFDDADDVLHRLSELIGPPGREKPAMERILDLIIEDGMTKYDRQEWLHSALTSIPTSEEILFKGYDKLLWARDEFFYKSRFLSRRPVPAKPNFYRSRLYAWYQAARDHVNAAQTIFGDLIRGRNG